MLAIYEGEDTPSIRTGDRAQQIEACSPSYALPFNVGAVRHAARAAKRQPAAVRR